MTSTSAAVRLVVCGTDTDVGKTVVSALLVQGLNAIYWKPVQSGLEEGGDRERVIKLIELPSERWIPETYAFQAAVSPHWAAELEDSHVDPKLLSLPSPERHPWWWRPPAAFMFHSIAPGSRLINCSSGCCPLCWWPAAGWAP